MAWKLRWLKWFWLNLGGSEVNRHLGPFDNGVIIRISRNLLVIKGGDRSISILEGPHRHPRRWLCFKLILDAFYYLIFQRAFVGFTWTARVMGSRVRALCKLLYYVRICLSRWKDASLLEFFGEINPIPKEFWIVSLRFWSNHRPTLFYTQSIEYFRALKMLIRALKPCPVQAAYKVLRFFIFFSVLPCKDGMHELI